jgi:hypothetical protein
MGIFNREVDKEVRRARLRKIARILLIAVGIGLVVGGVIYGLKAAGIM